MNHPVFKSPYDHMEADDLCRIGCWVSKAEWLKLTSLVPDRGFMTYLLSTLVHSLHEDFRKANLNVYDPSDDTYYARLAEIYNTRVATDGPTRAIADAVKKALDQAAGRDVGSGTERTRKASSKSSLQRPNPSSADRVGRGTRGRGAKADKDQEQTAES